MKSLVVTLVLAVAASAIGAGPAVASPCDDLAALSPRLSENKWRLGVKALEPTLHIEDARSSGGSTPKPTSPFETAIARSATVVDFVGAGSPWTVYVEHAPSTDLYLVYTVQGTARCQEEIVLRATSSASLQKVAQPPTYGGEVCLTESADLGEFRGSPVFVTHGPLDQITDNQDLQITPWTGLSWGSACRLSLTFIPSYKIDHTYCRDQPTCRSVSRIARLIAKRYDQSQESRIGEGFTFQTSTSKALQSRVAALMQDRSATPTPNFPTFGADPIDSYSWSYSGFAFFTLELDGRSYLAGIGHEGVGWREDNVTLLAIYDPAASDLKPTASFVISRSVAKLKAATVVPPVIDHGGPP